MLKPGELLDRKYRIIRLIGEGGMGAVYEAEHEAIRRHVAVKVLFPGFANDPDAVLRFHREAQAAGRIGHDNICEVIDIGQLPIGSPYLVMPLLKGEPLSDTIRREAPLALDRAVDIASQVLDALGAAHRAQIAHRDLKPDNLFVTRLGDRGIEFIKVLDFGISKILGSASVNDQKQVTKTGMVLGTPSYMAPEQARGMKNVDHRADLYALGTILFELLTGKRVFDGETYNEVLIKVVVDPVPPPRALRPEIPLEIEAVILRAMDREPANRYQSADEFRRELLLALDLVHGTGRHPVVEPTALAMPIPAPGPARPAPVAEGVAERAPQAQQVAPGPPGPAASSASVARTPDGTLAGRSSPSTLAAPRRRGPLVAALAGVAVVLAAGLVFLLLRGRGHSTEDGATPDAGIAATAPLPLAQRAVEPPRPMVQAPSPTPSVLTPSPTASRDIGSPSLLPNQHLVEQPAGNAPDAGEAVVRPGVADAASTPAPLTEEPGTVRVTFEGAPRGARVTVGGNPVDGMTATVPRSSTAIVVTVSAEGFERFRDSVVPSEHRVVRVRMRRTGTVATATRDAGGTPTGAGPTDAGRAEARTIGGRLGTMVVDDPENP